MSEWNALQETTHAFTCIYLLSQSGKRKEKKATVSNWQVHTQLTGNHQLCTFPGERNRSELRFRLLADENSEKLRSKAIQTQLWPI